MKARDIRRLKAIIKLLDVVREEVYTIEKENSLSDNFSYGDVPFAIRIKDIMRNLELNTK